MLDVAFIVFVIVVIAYFALSYASKRSDIRMATETVENALKESKFNKAVVIAIVRANSGLFIWDPYDFVRIHSALKANIERLESVSAVLPQVDEELVPVHAETLGDLRELLSLWRDVKRRDREFHKEWNRMLDRLSEHWASALSIDRKKRLSSMGGRCRE